MATVGTARRRRRIGGFFGHLRFVVLKVKKPSKTGRNRKARSGRRVACAVGLTSWLVVFRIFSVFFSLKVYNLSNEVIIRLIDTAIQSSLMYGRVSNLYYILMPSRLYCAAAPLYNLELNKHGSTCYSSCTILNNFAKNEPAGHCRWPQQWRCGCAVSAQPVARTAGQQHAGAAADRRSQRLVQPRSGWGSLIKL